MAGFWNKVSNIGLRKEVGIKSPAEKRNMFFNQLLFVGLFATFFQIIFVWPFIQEKSLVFLLVCLILAVGLYLNSKRLFTLSKWIYLPTLYSMGVLTTLLLGGSSLYHVQCLLIFASCLILFDFQKEKLQILFGIPFIIGCLYLGEASLSFVPDFSDHWWNSTARMANLSSLFSVSALLILFIIRLNGQNEKDLTMALVSLSDNARQLESARRNLEMEVEMRTAELEEQKQELERQNEEKATMLKEIHHRVRNNLQVIISLINLQLSKFKSDDVKNALSEVQNRVRSMAIVHQRMYQSSNFKEVELKDYTKRIIENIRELYNDSSDDAVIAIPESVKLDFERAIPTGLIINEMVTNFYKHAESENGHKSHFELSLELTDENGTIRYRDNGKGFPEGFKKEGSGSLGLLLIESLTDQLDGHFNFFNEDGAVYEVTIPNIKASTTVDRF